MFSLSTLLELTHILDKYVPRVIDRLITALDMEHMVHPAYGKFTNDDKINIILKTLKHPQLKGSDFDSFPMDVLLFIVNQYYHYQDDKEFATSCFFDKTLLNIEYDKRFSYSHPALANSLKRDGYVVEGRIIKKALPTEIDEAKTENEVQHLLTKFKFSVAHGHLMQGITNHSQGNWAGANAQFRTFIESLLIDISNHLLPNNKCTTASSAIKLLSNTVNPPFLRRDLNEVESNTCDKPFIEGLWKRLHPQGNHPGLSDEDDSTFRYHISIVVGYNLLSRLSKQK